MSRAIFRWPNRVKRVRRTPDEARRLILEAAQAAIARTGPEGLRLHDIAAAAGVSHPLILHHFGSRAGLVRALTREAIIACAAAEAPERVLESWPKQSDLIPDRRQFR